MILKKRKTFYVEGGGSDGIRTREACALALKTSPFDRSGTLPD
jgi:hypothetical protein